MLHLSRIVGKKTNFFSFSRQVVIIFLYWFYFHLILAFSILKETHLCFFTILHPTTFKAAVCQMITFRMETFAHHYPKFFRSSLCHILAKPFLKLSCLFSHYRKVSTLQSHRQHNPPGVRKLVTLH